MEMQGIDIESQQFLQLRALQNAQDLAQMNIDAESERLGRQLTAAEEQQIRDLASRESLLEMELTSREMLTQGDWQQQMERLILSEEGATDRANLDASTRVQLMELENLSQEQMATLNYYLQSNQIYSHSLDSLYANKDMPAPARDLAIQNFLALRNASANLPALIFGTNLNWPTSTPAPDGTAPPPTTAPTPTPTPEYTPPPTSAAEATGQAITQGGLFGLKQAVQTGLIGP
jgi:hypothetical protein